MTSSTDVLVIGGGFYGLYLAHRLASPTRRMTLIEREAEVMTRASYANQARVHGGYHYPRSLLTAGRSRANYARFLAEFPHAIQDRFEALYAIARGDSLVTAEQFAQAMDRIGAPWRIARPEQARWFNPLTIEAVFAVQEAAFDAQALRRTLLQRLLEQGVAIHTHTPALRLQPRPHAITVLTNQGVIQAQQVLLCAFAQTNSLLAASGLPIIPFRYEWAELACVEVPAALKHLGITVMDGPFFSCMPFPPRACHSLSHVRYTPHGQWRDGEPGSGGASQPVTHWPRRSAYAHMVRDAARFVPALGQARYRGSLWEVKTLLPRCEIDDARPILCRMNHGGVTGLHVVVGGKIDNVFDVAERLEGDRHLASGGGDHAECFSGANHLLSGHGVEG